MSRARLRTVTRAREALDLALAEALNLGDTGSLFKLCGPSSQPLWATASQRRHLEDIDRRVGRESRLEQLEVGEAWGVLVHRDDVGQLVRIRVRWVDPEAGSAPACSLIQPLALDALWRGALAAVDQHPMPLSLDPRRALRFTLTDLQGREEGISERVVGGSLGLSAAVATWSLLTRRRPPAATVFTGALGMAEGPGRVPVLAVGGLAAKAREVGLAGFRFVGPGLEGLAAELPDGLDAREVRSVHEALDLAYGPDRAEPARCPELPGLDPGVALELLDLDYRRRSSSSSWTVLRLRFDHLARHGRLHPSGRALAQARAAACLCHMGQGATALPELDGALATMAALADPLSLPGDVEVITRIHRGVALRDCWRFEEALEELECAESLAREARLPREAANARSTRGQVLSVLGRGTEALPLLQQARRFYDERSSFECPRNHTYVVDACGRLGDLEAARREREEGLAHNRERGERNQRQGNRAFADYAWLAARLDRCREAALWPEGPGAGHGAEDPWLLHHDAAEALEACPRGMLWPRAGLEVVSWGARLLALAEGPGADLALERLVECTGESVDPATHPAASGLHRWVWARGYLEGAVLHARHGELERARGLVDQAWSHAPEGALRHHAALRRAVDQTTSSLELAALVHALIRARNY